MSYLNLYTSSNDKPCFGKTIYIHIPSISKTENMFPRCYIDLSYYSVTNRKRKYTNNYCYNNNYNYKRIKINTEKDE